jgi:hypothetical protein
MGHPSMNGYFEVDGKKVPITAETVAAFKLGFQEGFRVPGDEPEVASAKGDDGSARAYMLMMRNDWLLGEGVSRELL